MRLEINHCRNCGAVQGDPPKGIDSPQTRAVYLLARRGDCGISEGSAQVKCGNCLSRGPWIRGDTYEITDEIVYAAVEGWNRLSPKIGSP